MLYSPKLYLKDWWVNVPLLFALALEIFMWWYLLAHFHAASDQFFLHYNIIFGVDLVGNWWQIFYFPTGGLMAILLNYFFSFLVYEEDRLLARFICVWTALVILCLTGAVWYISGLNI